MFPLRTLLLLLILLPVYTIAQEPTIHKKQIVQFEASLQLSGNYPSCERSPYSICVDGRITSTTLFDKDALFVIECPEFLNGLLPAEKYSVQVEVLSGKELENRYPLCTNKENKQAFLLVNFFRESGIR